MSELWLAIIGILGTLAGVTIAGINQSRVAKVASIDHSKMQYREIATQAIIEFATALGEYRRAELGRAFANLPEDGSSKGVHGTVAPPITEVRHLRTVVRAKAGAIEFLIMDDQINKSISALIERTKNLQRCETRETLVQAGNDIEECLTKILGKCRKRVWGSVEGTASN